MLPPLKYPIRDLSANKNRQALHYVIGTVHPDVPPFTLTIAERHQPYPELWSNLLIQLLVHGARSLLVRGINRSTDTTAFYQYFHEYY